MTVEQESTAPVPEAGLLAEALDVPPRALHLISREPLGTGSVTGFEVTETSAAPTVSYVDTSLLSVPIETGLVQEGVARVWTHPADPHLPALAAAAFGEAVGALLSRIGSEATAAPEIVSYRPGRRAVLRVAERDGTAWIKVVRPRRVQRIVDAHSALRAGGIPVPAIRAWSPDGLLVIDAARGTPATDARWDPEALVSAVSDLRERIAGVSMQRAARTSLAARVPWYVERLDELAPAEHSRVARLATTVRVGLENAPGETTIHGDLHFGQLFLSGTGSDIDISGLIDVDTAGRGDPADDAAAFLSHAVASAILTGTDGDRDRALGLVVAAQQRWGGDERTRALTIIQLLGHALAAAMHSGAEHVAELLDAAERLGRGETALRTT